MPLYTEKLFKLKIANPTLRDCFDPESSEFADSTIEEKVDTLKEVIANDFSLQKLTEDYCKYYNDMDKPYVAHDLHRGLKTLINHLLSKHTEFDIEFEDDYSNSDLVEILILLLKDTGVFPLKAKEIFYKHLVEKRKKYQFTDSLYNPSELNLKFDEHLNAWAYWYGNLNADILLIGQDFGDYTYYYNNEGKDNSSNPTNYNLFFLFKELGINIGQSDDPNNEAKLYFTNAVLAVKTGGMAAPIKKSWYRDTAQIFTKPLIKLIKPKIIIAMGSKAYDVVSMIFNLGSKPMKELVEISPISLGGDGKLFVVYHCSSLGIINRNFESQLSDWRKIGTHLGLA